MHTQNHIKKKNIFNYKTKSSTQQYTVKLKASKIYENNTLTVYQIFITFTLTHTHIQNNKSRNQVPDNY